MLRFLKKLKNLYKETSFKNGYNFKTQLTYLWIHLLPKRLQIKNKMDFVNFWKEKRACLE